MTSNSIPPIDTRYIFYDGYNEYEVSNWLMERQMRTCVTSRNLLLYVNHIMTPHDVVCVRPREYLFIQNGELRAMSTKQLIEEYLSIRVGVYQPTHSQLLQNLREFANSTVHPNRDRR